MKGIIACGGLGTRLYPLTHAMNKHLLPIYDKPMIYYPIQTLVESGVTDILCVVGGPYAGYFFNAIKDGKELGVKNLTYVYQEGVGGAGEALMLAEDFAHGEPVVFILGDQVTDASLSKAIKNFRGGATVLLQKYMDPDGMGVPVFDADDPSKIISIEENPSHPKSEYAATGIYIYDNECFSYTRESQKTVKGEIKPTHINNKYIANGKLYWEYLDGYWVDAGKFDRLNEANNYFAKKASAQ